MTLDILGNTPEAVKTLVVKASIDTVSVVKNWSWSNLLHFSTIPCVYGLSLKLNLDRNVHNILHEMAQFMYFLVLFFSFVSV